MKKSMFLLACSLWLGVAVVAAEPSSTTNETTTTTASILVGSNVIQTSEYHIFTSFTLTNTTPFWFNPQIYLIDANGVIVRKFAPLIKSFGTWQKPSGDFIDEDFQGSIWIVSSQPLVASAFIYQYEPESGKLTLLGNSQLSTVTPEAADAALQRFAAEGN